MERVDVLLSEMTAMEPNDFAVSHVISPKRDHNQATDSLFSEWELVDDMLQFTK